MLVDVGHEDPAVLRARKGVGLIDARAAVRRAVPVIGDRLDVAVDVRIEVLAALALVDAAGDDVPEVRDHAGADEELALGVVVDAPRVAEAVRDDLEHVLRRVIPPDAAVDLDAVALRGGPRETALCVCRRRPLPCGFLTFEGVAYPCSPYSHPSGPQCRLFSVSWRSRMPQPVRRTSISAMSALSSPLRSGTNSRLGGAPTNTPSKPTAMRGGKDDPFHEHLAAVGDAVVIGVFQDQDAAVPGIRESAVRAIS